MTRRDGKRSAVLPLTLATTLVVLTAAPSWADFGFGFFGGFNYVPSPGNMLDQRSLAQTARGIQSRPSHSPYANNSNSYFNRVRDNGLVSHYDVWSGGSPAYRPTSRRSAGATAPPPPSATAPAAPAAKPKVPVADFFNASGQLVWPAESPVKGELQALRDTSDAACRAVLDETKRQRIASLTTVAEARERLLDYGRPALQEVRTSQTPRIADGFHQFLLSLYESLAQAAQTSR